MYEFLTKCVFLGKAQFAPMTSSLEKSRDFEKTVILGKSRDFEKPVIFSKVIDHVLKRGGVGPSPHCLLTCFSG